MTEMEYPMEAVEEAAAELQTAVTTTMNPSVSQVEREAAYQHCQNFKEHSLLCIPVGVHLSDSANPPMIRHFGMHLLDHVIKMKWNQLKKNERTFIKGRTMEMIKLPHSLQENYIRAAASILVAEIAKRDWPQYWKYMIKDFNQIAEVGPDQAETVVLTILRLAEDVVTLQTLNNHQRRRDLHQQLTNPVNMMQILELVVKILNHNVTESSNEEIPVAQREKHARVAIVTLELINNLMEWVPAGILSRPDMPLLPTLCELLTHQKFRDAAADALTVATSRKGRAEDRKFVFRLFSGKEFGRILATTQSVLEEPVTEESYNVLKKLANVVSSLGVTLATVHLKMPSTNIPTCFSEFLDLALRLSTHPSYTIVLTMNSLWSSIFANQRMSAMEVVQKMIPKWLECAALRLKKHGSAPSPTEPAGQYMVMDFEDEEAFLTYMIKVRQDVCQTLRKATVTAPILTYDFVAEWTRRVLALPVPDDENVNLTRSPEYVEWEALALAADHIYGRYNVIDKKPPLKTSLLVLKDVLDFKSDNPTIISVWLSVVSAMFVFVASSTSNLPVVLDKIFACVKYTKEGETKETRSRAVKNLRRHACSLMVKISKNHPKALFPHFETLLLSMQVMVSETSNLSQMEKVTLFESLMLLSNEFKNYELQYKFIDEIMCPVKKDWENLLPAFQSTPDFISFIGLDKPPVEPSESDVHGQNRASIVFCVHLFHAVLKRIGRVEGRNPCAPHILQVLPGVLSLIGAINGLWHPEAKFTRAFSNVLDMLNSDKRALFGNVVNPADRNALNPSDSAMGIEDVRTPFDRMQQFIHAVHDTSCLVLGLAFSSLGRDIYGEPPGRPGLAEGILCTTFSFLDLMPDYRIRSLVRITLKQLIVHAPSSSYDSLLIPVLTKLCPFFFAHLNSRWQARETPNAGGLGEETPEKLEMLDDQLRRLLTREYMHVLQFVLFGADGNSKGEPMEEDVDESAAVRTSQQLTMSELGQKVLTTPVLGESIILSIFNALCWGDAVSCVKATTFCAPVLRWLSVGPRLNSEQACELLTYVLRALQIHGEHEVNQGTLLNLTVLFYQLMRKHFEQLDGILKEVPEVREEMIKETGNTVRANGSEKHKRERMRSLLNPIIGQPVSQLGKLDIYIKSLPKLSSQAPRRKTQDVFTTESGEIGLSNLFASIQNGSEEHANGAEEEPMDS